MHVLLSVAVALPIAAVLTLNAWLITLAVQAARGGERTPVRGSGTTVGPRIRDHRTASTVHPRVSLVTVRGGYH
jgi:hypothetical protein